MFETYFSEMKTICIKYIAISCILFANINNSLFAQPISYKINTKETLQRIDGFGASDAWTIQFVGLWPKAKTEKIADWLFSTKNDEHGNPKGIGLSIWRFNLGAGSAEQGDSSHIDFGTRTDCFLQKDGSYNWNKQAGQRNFLHLAKERGVKIFLAFLNSPPVYFTQNGWATNTGRNGTYNLRSDAYPHFVSFLANIVEGLNKHDGIHFSYLSPVNEPDGTWNWLGSNQEGSPATNKEIAKLTRMLGNEFHKRGIKTKILIDESSNYWSLYKPSDQQRGRAIQAFFNKNNTDTYIGDVPNVPRMVVGHSYWTNTPLDSLRQIRRTLNDSLNKYKVGFWQTELCIMSNDKEIGCGEVFDRTMKTALYVGRVIHHDLVYAHASSWQWWRAIVGNYKDGLLSEQDDSHGKDDNVVDSKLLWLFGNYSRFVRPGATRLATTVFDQANRIIPEGDTDPHGLMCTAFRNKNKELIFVVLNYADTDKQIVFNANTNRKWTPYITSDKEKDNLRKLENINEGSIFTIPARSAVTFVSKQR